MYIHYIIFYLFRWRFLRLGHFILIDLNNWTNGDDRLTRSFFQKIRRFFRPWSLVTFSFIFDRKPILRVGAFRLSEIPLGNQDSHSGPGNNRFLNIILCLERRAKTRFPREMDICHFFTAHFFFYKGRPACKKTKKTRLCMRRKKSPGGGFFFYPHTCTSSLRSGV